MNERLWPRIAPIAVDGTSRLIPGAYADAPERVLGELVDTAAEADDLVRIAALTNPRLQAQSGHHPGGLGPADLVFGVPFSKIINGAFSYPGAQGARFHPPTGRGAWYCTTTVDTAVAEVVHHRVVHLAETGLDTEAGIVFAEFLSDIHAQEFAWLDDDSTATRACLDPDSHEAGQQLGAHLRAEGRGGVWYPSVRDPGGTCLAVLQAPIVANVRRGAQYRVTIEHGTCTELTRIAPQPG